jgi:hypothetical protein
MTMSKGQTVVGVGIIDGGGMLSYGEQTDSDVEQSEEEMAIQDVVDCPVLVMVTKHGMGRRIPVRFCFLVDGMRTISITTSVNASTPGEGVHNPHDERC